MTLLEYSEKSAETLIPCLRNDDFVRLCNLSLGLHEECSEVAKIIRRPELKGNYHEQDIDINHLKEECGNVLWYIATLGKEIGYNLSDIAKSNIQKTYNRYLKMELEVEKEKLDFKGYQEMAEATLKSDLVDDKQKRIWISCTGISGECGDISKKIKEHVVDSTVLKSDKIKERLGDSLWYLSCICDTFNIQLEEVVKLDLKKRSDMYNENGELKSKEENYTNDTEEACIDR